jgi:hypothetical protein
MAFGSYTVGLHCSEHALKGIHRIHTIKRVKLAFLNVVGVSMANLEYR